MKIVRWIFRVLGIFFLMLLAAETVIYFWAPVYDFTPPGRFSGDKFYNPYEGLDSAGWRKCNFHFHVREWWGLTAGRSNSPEEFYRIYKMLFYDAPQISNYQSISRHFADSAFYIPVYEHGFGIRKKHQMLLGAKSVLWLDYSLFQNLNHKQHVLDLLRPSNDIVAIAHPDWENGYSLKDMQYLTNYDLVEALDNNWRSLPQWDAALSSGHAVWLLADDDAHDIDNVYQIQRCATYIYSPVLHKDSLIASLKKGRAYGAEIYMGDNWTFEDKKEWALQVPRLNYCRMSSDTLKVSVSGKVFKTVFIGQDGKIRKSVYGGNEQWYRFAPEDTYIRVQIVFLKYHKYPYVGQGDIFYLNPVIRYRGGEVPQNHLQAEVNLPRTWIFRIMSFGSVILIILVMYKFRKLKKTNND